MHTLILQNEIMSNCCTGNLVLKVPSTTQLFHHHTNNNQSSPCIATSELYKVILTTSAVSSTNLGPILIFASCVLYLSPVFSKFHDQSVFITTVQGGLRSGELTPACGSAHAGKTGSKRSGEGPEKRQTTGKWYGVVLNQFTVLQV